MRANDRKDVLTYRRFVNIMNRVNKTEDIHLLENKSHFNKFFAEFIHRDWVLSSELSASEIADFIMKHKKVIIKPFDEMDGHGIYMIDSEKTENLLAKSEELANSQVMIEEILSQHKGMVFGNTSVNTIRVHTILDQTGKGHIISCVLRAGVGDTVVDNYCSGGVIYPINTETGIVSGKGKSRLGNNHYIHPETDIVMLGYQVPNWDILKKETIKAAEKLPNLRLVGWDVAITENGIALIEGNHNPDYELYEFIGEGKSYPLLKKYI